MILFCPCCSASLVCILFASRKCDTTFFRNVEDAFPSLELTTLSRASYLSILPDLQSTTPSFCYFFFFPLEGCGAHASVTDCLDMADMELMNIFIVGGNAVSAFLSWRLQATNACDVTLVWKSGFEHVAQYGISFK